MVYFNDFLFKTDRAIAYYSNADFILEVSKVNNFDEFSKLMKTKKGNEKQLLEEGIIFLESKEKKEDFQINFLEKYKKYIKQTLEDNVMEYFNNYYVSYCFCKKWSMCTNESDYETIFYGKTMNNIFELLDKKYDELLNKIKNKNELTIEEREFFENLILNYTINGSVADDSYNDIIEYFNLYPIQNIENLKNRQLYFIYIASKKISQINPLCELSFNTNTNLEGVEGDTLGVMISTLDGKSGITINYMDIYSINSEKKFYEHLFTLLHEIGHLKQTMIKDEKTRNFYNMENFLISENLDFYIEHHDEFHMESDADMYAIEELKREFGKDNPLVIEMCDRKLKTILSQDIKKFTELEIEEYKKIIERKNLQKGNKQN